MKNRLYTILTVIALALAIQSPTAKADGIFEQQQLTDSQQVAAQLTSGMDAEVHRRAMFRVQAWRNVWENPKCTPQQILSALGTNAVKVLTASTVDAGWFTSLATATGKPVSTFIDPKYLAVKSGWTITPHQDGTASVTPPM